MPNRTAVFCLLFAGCAAGGAGVDRETAPHAAPRIGLTARADTARMFPVAKDPQLPSADRMFRHIRNELGDVASADVRLCVAPDGRVQDVAIVRGTRLPEFDEALVHDMAHWQFSESPRPAGAASPRICEVTTISYRPHP
jgi:TonB family protein